MHQRSDEEFTMATTPPPDLGPKTARNLERGMIALLLVSAIITVLLLLAVFTTII